MDLIVFIIGVGIPIVIGWLALLLLERHEPVLAPGERWFWAMTLGPTLLMLIVFVCHIVGVTKLNLVGFLVPAVGSLLVLGMLCMRSGTLAVRSFSPPLAVSRRLSRLTIVAIALLTLWTVVKVFAGAYELVTVPTYWDDSFNNWNMRGKIFFEHQRIELTIPIGNGTIQTEGGVSSYPVALPMLKTWVSVLRGQWHEPIVNGLHLLWIVGLSGCFYFALRRRL